MHDAAPHAPHWRALTDGLHEIYAASHADAACLSGSLLMLGRDTATETTLWVRHGEHDREDGAIFSAGLAELGVAPSCIVLVAARDPASTLQAALEGARCAALGSVILDLRGAAKAYDLTASRRLALAAKASGIRVLMARTAHSIPPSAAETRWRLRALPSRELAACAPGNPAFELTLLRARNGQEGLHYHLEWDRDARQLIPRQQSERPVPDHRGSRHAISSLPRTVVPLSFHRPGVETGHPRREAG